MTQHARPDDEAIRQALDGVLSSALFPAPSVCVPFSNMSSTRRWKALAIS